MTLESTSSPSEPCRLGPVSEGPTRLPACRLFGRPDVDGDSRRDGGGVRREREPPDVPDRGRRGAGTRGGT